MFRRVTLTLAVTLGTLASPVHADDWTVQRDPFDRGVIAKYKAILARDPHDAAALANLVALYRRHRTVELLRSEYTSDVWATHVVLGHLHRRLGDVARARAAFERAVLANETDAQTWHLLGTLAADSGDADQAHAAYATALHHARSREQIEPVLRALLALALARGDHASADTYLVRLIELAPRDPQRWIDRGDTMLAGGNAATAVASYEAAERLLATDPMRRIEVIARGGVALDQLGLAHEAVAEYRRAIALSPPRSHLIPELTTRIIDTYRRAGALDAILARYEQEWPLRKRGPFEWTTLAALYEETGVTEMAIVALERAVALAPAELELQKDLIRVLDAAGRGDEALARHELLARAAPTDVKIQLDLAKRSFPEPAAFEVLDRLARHASRDVEVLAVIAEVYLEWQHVELAAATYEKIAAITAKTRNPAALARFGTRMLEHGFFEIARTTFSDALELAPNDTVLWRGRSLAYEGLRNYLFALRDAERVLELLDEADRTQRRAARHHVVQILMRAQRDQTAPETQDLAKVYLKAWTYAFAERPPDLESGYFLAAFYEVSPRDDQPVATLRRLRALIPDDPAITADLASAERSTALAMVHAYRPPQLGDRNRLDDPFPDDNWDYGPAVTPKSFAVPVRAGMRFGMGTGVYGDVENALTLGVTGAVGLAPALSFVWRLDWTQRLGPMGTVHAMGTSLGVTARAVSTSRIALLVGAAPRAEVRFGDEAERTGWGRSGLAADLTADLVIRNAPFTIGARFEQWFSARAAAMIELAWGWR